MVELRAFRDDDAARLAAIATESFSDEVERGMPEFTEDYFSGRAEKQAFRLWVAEMEGEVVGFAVLTESNIEVPAQLHLVAVERTHRGRGVGKLLVAEAARHAEAKGAGKLKLMTRPWNHAMRAVCASLGFTEEAYLRREYLGEDLVQYALFY